MADAAALAAPLANYNTADAVEFLNTLDLTRAAETLAALPLPRAVKMLEAPELHRSGELVAALPPARAAALLGLMADDRATDIVHELDEEERARLIPLLGTDARQVIQKLLSYPPNTAALMTTEYVAVPASWTVAQTLQHIRQVERTRETVYAIYVLVPASQQLQQVVTMRRLITGLPEESILDVAQVNPPVTVDALMDQEEVARLIRRHDLLAIPVVDAQQQMLGIVTVDDVLDALIEESTEDAHKFGGMEALDKPYMQIGFFEMLRARRLAERAVPGRDADGQRDAALRGRTGARGGADPVHPIDHEFGWQFRLAGHLAADPQPGTARTAPARLVEGGPARSADRHGAGRHPRLPGHRAHRDLAAGRPARLRRALDPAGDHHRRRAGGHRHLRFAVRLDAAPSS